MDIFFGTKNCTKVQGNTKPGFCAKLLIKINHNKRTFEPISHPSSPLTPLLPRKERGT